MGYRESAQSPQWYIYICSFCDKPTFFDEKGAQTPGVAYGNPIEHLPDDIAALYKEARNCMAVRSYTAAVLICRKLLMNIAVSQKAKENQSFMYYVDYLASQGYVPPNGRTWVDHIRTKSNEANHEIALMFQSDAEQLISFTEMLLKFVYEFPGKLPPTP
jgi:hypothetical protein